MGKLLDWQKKYGFKTDPFEKVPPLPTKKFIIGTDELQERIKSFAAGESRIATISGESGTGKTMLLLWAREELAGAYLDAMQQAKRDEIVNALLKSKLSFFERLKGAMKLPQAQKEGLLLQRLKAPLLIDNAGQLGRPELDLLTEIITRTPVHIILADTQENLKELELPAELAPKLKLKLPEYRDDHLLELLRRRVAAAGGRMPFDDGELSSLFKRADRNPAALLDLARERAIELGAQQSKPISITVEQKPAGAGIKIETTPAPKEQQIRIEAEKPKEQAPAIQIIEEKKEAPPMALPEQHAADAVALSQVVKEVEKKQVEQKPKLEKPATIEQVVQVLPKKGTIQKKDVVKLAKQKKAVKRTRHDRIIAQVVKRPAGKPKAPKKAKKKV